VSRWSNRPITFGAGERWWRVRVSRRVSRRPLRATIRLARRWRGSRHLRVHPELSAPLQGGQRRRRRKSQLRISDFGHPRVGLSRSRTSALRRRRWRELVRAASRNRRWNRHLGEVGFWWWRSTRRPHSRWRFTHRPRRWCARPEWRLTHRSIFSFIVNRRRGLTIHHVGHFFVVGHGWCGWARRGARRGSQRSYLRRRTRFRVTRRTIARARRWLLQRGEFTLRMRTAVVLYGRRSLRRPASRSFLISTRRLVCLCHTRRGA
jgi:hypothetical protein